MASFFEWLKSIFKSRNVFFLSRVRAGRGTKISSVFALFSVIDIDTGEDR